MFSKPVDELRELASAFRLFSHLITAGVPIIYTFKMIEKTFLRLQPAFSSIHDSVKEGENISPVMRRFGDVFPRFTCGLMDVGESLGSVDYTSLFTASILEGVVRLRESGVPHSLKDEDIDQISDILTLSLFAGIMDKSNVFKCAIGCVSPKMQETLALLIPKIEAGVPLANAMLDLPEGHVSTRFVMIMADASSEAEGLHMAADELAELRLGIKNLSKLEPEEIFAFFAR